MTASVPDACPGTTYDWGVFDGVGNDLSGTITGQGTNAIGFPAAAAGSRMIVNLTQLAGGCPTGPTATRRAQVNFADVAASHPQHLAICTAGASGLSNGCGAGNFCPDNTVHPADARAGGHAGSPSQ